MVGDVCDVDWLSEQLLSSMSSSSSSTCPASRVLVVDCRSPLDYQASHIAGAVHLTVPTLMLRRLTTGNLPVSSIVSCFQDETSEDGDGRSKNETLVLHDESSRDLTDDLSTCPTQLTSGYVISVLLRRLKEDGFRVYLLDGGYAAFSQKYPHLCVTSPQHSQNSPDVSTVLGLHRLRLQQQQQQQQHHQHRGSQTAPAATTVNVGGGDGGNDVGDDDIGADPSAPTADVVTSFPVEVLPFLFLGNARSSGDLDVLYRNGISYILNVTPDVPNAFEGNEQFRYLQIPINDHWSQNMTAYFPDAIAFIDEARRNECGVLVHCLAGISRSVTVTVAYLMHSLNMSLDDAYDHVKRCKPNVSPNFSFMGQLMDYERTLRSGRRRSSATSAPTSAVVAADEPTSLTTGGGGVGGEGRGVATTPASADVDAGGPCIVCGDVDAAEVVVGGRRCACDSTSSTSGVARTCYSSPVSSLSSLSTSSSAPTTLSSSSSAASASAFDYELPGQPPPPPVTTAASTLSG